MTPQLKPHAIKPGMILHSRSNSMFGRFIRAALTRWIQREKPDAVPVWGNHDALVVEVNGRLFIGDAVSPFCRATPLEKWDAWLRDGSQSVRVFWPANATEADGRKAAEYWVRECLGKPYDWMSFPRLLFKSVFGELSRKLMGWEWAWFCTESVGRSWYSVYGDTRVLGKFQPTPLTVEKRAGFYPGDRVTLEEVTGDVVENTPEWSCIMDVWKPRPEIADYSEPLGVG